VPKAVDESRAPVHRRGVTLPRACILGMHNQCSRGSSLTGLCTTTPRSSSAGAASGSPQGQTRMGSPAINRGPRVPARGPGLRTVPGAVPRGPAGGGGGLARGAANGRAEPSQPPAAPASWPQPRWPSPPASG
jgi:hypothetical protein